MSKAFVFPGQGSQSVGMGKALADAFPAAAAVFAEVDEALGEKLSSLSFEGPEADLTLTANAQPALMAVSIAVLRVLQEEAGLDLGRDAAFVAGHSLGEYSALAAAGSFSLADTARLLRLRGEAMQKAVPVGQGAMAAILGLEFDPVAAVAAEAAQKTGAVCQAANDNGGGQVVISGARDAVALAMDLAKAAGCIRAQWKGAIKAPVVPLVANVLARPITAPEEIRRRLVEQVTGTVRWRESIGYMAAEGVDTFYELGAGKVLAGLVKRIADTATGIAIGTPADVAAYSQRG